MGTDNVYTPAQATWDFLREPCRIVGCDAVLTMFIEQSDFSVVIQHGKNPEHRHKFTEEPLKHGKVARLVTEIRQWIEKVHSPRPWEVEDKEVTE